MPGLKAINIKSDLPTVEEARQRLLQHLAVARKEGCVVVKLIHGYGSTGVGGALRPALRKSLARRRKEGVIQSFVPGERWDPLEPASRALLDACPALRHDPDLARGNEGITLILL